MKLNRDYEVEGLTHDLLVVGSDSLHRWSGVVADRGGSKGDEAIWLGMGLALSVLCASCCPERWDVGFLQDEIEAPAPGTAEVLGGLPAVYWNPDRRANVYARAHVLLGLGRGFAGSDPRAVLVLEERKGDPAEGGALASA